jgi:hexosaminidase
MSGALVSLTAKDPAANISYSLNHSNTFLNYTKPFTVKGDVTIQAMASVRGNLIPADTAEATVTGISMLKAIKSGEVSNGLHYFYFEADNMSMATLKNDKPVKEGIANEISLTIKQRKEKFGIIYEGYIRIDKTGGYQFFSQSDDGSILSIDGKEIVNNDGNHGFDEKAGRCILEKGYHRFKLAYFDSGGGNDLSVKYQPFGKEKINIPAALLYH